MAKVKIVSDRLNTFFTNNRIATGTAAPTSGTWKVGDIVISTTQSGVIGWVCTIAGTPGTWETIQSKEDLSAAFAAKTHTHNYAGSSSAGGAATSALTCTGNSATATKLQTARTLTVGNTGKTFDGSGNVSWSLAEMGVGTLSNLKTTAKADIVSAINELFQSVSNGKQLVANAITDKGVKTLATDSFTTMSNNISKIDTGNDIMVDGKPIDKEFELISVGEKTTMQNSLPYSFLNGSAVVFNNELHILGGGDSSSDHTKHYKFNGTTWTQVSTLPYKFYYGSAVVFNNEIHILGGGDSSSDHTKHYKFNGTSWTRVSTLPYNFYQGSAVVFNNEIHILGSSYSSDYTKHYKFNGTRWTQVSTLPGNFYNGSAVVFNNEIHILGGAHYSSYTKHHKYNGRSWIASISKLPYNLYYGSAVVYNNEIRILGGMGGEDKYYKYSGSSWTQLSTLPYSFYQGSAVVYNNEVHILGSGYSSNYTKHYKSYMIYIINIK